MPADLTPQIETAAAEPKTATSDGQSATHHDLADLVAADRYLKGATAVTGTNVNGGPLSAWGATRPARAIFPGGPR